MVYLQLLSICVSFSAIFISNWLGRKDEDRKFKRSQKLKRYNDFYIPFIKFFYENRPSTYLFFFMVVNGSYKNLYNLIVKNLEYLDPKSTEEFYRLSTDSVDQLQAPANELIEKLNNKDLEGTEIKFNDEQQKSYDRFNDFVLSVLKESECLAEELGLEPIGKSLYDIYSKSIRRPQ